MPLLHKGSTGVTISRVKLPFIEDKLGRDFTRAEFYEELGVGSTFPRVKLEDELIGGCTETVKYLKENDLV